MLRSHNDIIVEAESLEVFKGEIYPEPRSSNSEIGKDDSSEGGGHTPWEIDIEFPETALAWAE